MTKSERDGDTGRVENLPSPNGELERKEGNVPCQQYKASPSTCTREANDSECQRGSTEDVELFHAYTAVKV